MIIFLVFSHGSMQFFFIYFFIFLLICFIGNQAHFSFEVLTRLLFQWLSSFNSISKFSQYVLNHQTKQLLLLAVVCPSSLSFNYKFSTVLIPKYLFIFP